MKPPYMVFLCRNCIFFLVKPSILASGNFVNDHQVCGLKIWKMNHIAVENHHANGKIHYNVNPWWIMSTHDFVQPKRLFMAGGDTISIALWCLLYYWNWENHHNSPTRVYESGVDITRVHTFFSRPKKIENQNKRKLWLVQWTTIKPRTYLFCLGP